MYILKKISSEVKNMEKVKVKLSGNKTVNEILQENEAYKKSHLLTYKELYRQCGVKSI